MSGTTLSLSLSSSEHKKLSIYPLLTRAGPLEVQDALLQGRLANLKKAPCAIQSSVVLYNEEEASIDNDLAAGIEAGLKESVTPKERSAADLTAPEDEEEDTNDCKDVLGCDAEA
ncbi:hypothetical protein H4Q26_017593 [Puccinia striiformis f. sp. tritici PST-130]|nr:hypothetical protein H4Q26_017593 [Puccinia striiformis f. sp. tritici PST-130]